MGNQGESGVPEPESSPSHSPADMTTTSSPESEPPPAYGDQASTGMPTASSPTNGADLSVTPLSQESGPPPDYEGQASNSISVAATSSSLYRPIPPVLKAYSSWNHLKSFNLCGAGGDALYVVELHTGYSGKPPLGARPGMLLHNGTSKECQVVAASGDVSQLAGRVYALETESVILLPPAGAHAHQNSPLVTERMHARTYNDNVAFSFGIEVGPGEKLRREEFVWAKIKKGADPNAKDGGFRLVWPLSARSASQLAASSAVGGGSRSSQAVESEGEVVAFLEWASSSFSSLRRMFTLRYLGSGLSGSLGERWKLMVVMTALRLWQLKIQGRTAKSFVAIGEKVHGKRLIG